ncbi:multicopper oxidase family protein [Paenibacillus sp. CC-CFT747]|nr:multicopper oxidase family protein [Paenibacillus sp. CC-CFT747]
MEVAELTGDISAPADVRFELTAQRTELTLASGAKVEAWTYNGEAVPELRVKEGQMVEVVLANRDVEAGVSIHWHGYDVPNAMDGIPGMTQNAVKPGESFRYKFRAKQTGTYWFHSHQQSSEQVEKGLFGRLIVEPAEEPSPYDVEETIVLHRWKTDRGYRTAFGLEDGTRTLPIPSGRTVRLRIINTDNLSAAYLLQGTPYAVTAIDGTPIRQAALLPENTSLRIGSGGRYDLTFRMPDGPVYLKAGAADAPEGPVLVLSPDNDAPAPVFQPASGSFEPGHYGEAVENEVTAEAAKFDREFRMIFGNRMGFYNGVFHFLWTINGRVLPNTPTFVVKEGEKVKMTFVNRSLAEHPMHLHGHHMTVLKHNGKRVVTPWITDTLNVAPGDTYEVGFVADNPGMWMDHCHNLYHAATGMILHLMYDGVRPSYEAGTRSGNLPD